MVCPENGRRSRHGCSCHYYSCSGGGFGALFVDFDEGLMNKFSCQYRGMDLPRKMATMFGPEEGETWWCKGKVTNKYMEDDQHIVECDIWVENGQGEKTTPGSAAVILPSRG